MGEADVAIIGGDARQRCIMAIKLRRKGIIVHSELTNRKRSKMFSAAKAETGDADRVFDMDDEGQLERLHALSETAIRIETKRVFVAHHPDQTRGEP